MTSFPSGKKGEDKGVQDEGVKEAQKRAAPHRAPDTMENRQNPGMRKLLPGGTGVRNDKPLVRWSKQGWMSEWGRSTGRLCTHVLFSKSDWLKTPSLQINSCLNQMLRNSLCEVTSLVKFGLQY